MFSIQNSQSNNMMLIKMSESPVFGSVKVFGCRTVTDQVSGPLKLLRFVESSSSYDHFWCLKRKTGGVPCQKHS